jgi:hypothetical protein
MSSPQVSERTRTEPASRSSSSIDARFSPSFEGQPSTGILERDLESAAHAESAAPLDQARPIAPVHGETWCAPGVHRA